jgi:hypothetical protein
MLFQVSRGCGWGLSRGWVRFTGRKSNVVIATYSKGISCGFGFGRGYPPGVAREWAALAGRGVAFGESGAVRTQSVLRRLMQMIIGYCRSGKPEQQRASDQECVGFHNRYSITTLPPRLGYASFGGSLPIR